MTGATFHQTVTFQYLHDVNALRRKEWRRNITYRHSKSYILKFGRHL